MVGRLDVKLVEKDNGFAGGNWTRVSLYLCMCNFIIAVVPKVKNCRNYETRKERRQARCFCLLSFLVS